MVEKPTFDQLVDRVEKLEQRSIDVGDLPLGPLQRKLEQGWFPSGALLLESRSVTSEQLGAGTVISPSGQRLRVVAGIIQSTGAVLVPITGGFTATRTAAGRYTVTFTTPFLTDPAIGTSTPAGGVNLTAGGTGSFGVFIFNTATFAAIDTAWHFTAIGLDA